MRRLLFVALAMMLAAFCPMAQAQGGVVIRPNGPCGPTVPGNLMVMYSTMSHDVIVSVTQIANGAATELTIPMRPHAQYELGCSVRGLAQWSWTIKSVKLPVVPPAPGRRAPN